MRKSPTSTSSSSGTPPPEQPASSLAVATEGANHSSMDEPSGMDLHQGDWEDGEIDDESKTDTSDSTASSIEQPLRLALNSKPPDSVIAKQLSELRAINDEHNPNTLSTVPGSSSPEPLLILSPQPISPLSFVASISPSGEHSFPTTLSHEELDRAKSLVLDLLGWGVEPEYLVTCGISHQIIYRIFTDLRLRLPTNLDIPT